MALPGAKIELNFIKTAATSGAARPIPLVVTSSTKTGEFSLENIDFDLESLTRSFEPLA
jgi:hypothetical protein